MVILGSPLVVAVELEREKAHAVGKGACELSLQVVRTQSRHILYYYVSCWLGPYYFRGTSSGTVVK